MIHNIIDIGKCDMALSRRNVGIAYIFMCTCFDGYTHVSFVKDTLEAPKC